MRGGGANAAAAVRGRLVGAEKEVAAAAADEEDEEDDEDEEDEVDGEDGITWRLLTCACGAGMRTSSRNLRNGSSDGWLYHAQNSSKLSRPSLRGGRGEWVEWVDKWNGDEC